jgi:hypothetical protein
VTDVLYAPECVKLTNLSDQAGRLDWTFPSIAENPKGIKILKITNKELARSFSVWSAIGQKQFFNDLLHISLFNKFRHVIAYFDRPFRYPTWITIV